MHANFLYGGHVHSTGNETIAWQHLQIEHGGHEYFRFYQVFIVKNESKWMLNQKG